jgi:toxin CcdB
MARHDVFVNNHGDGFLLDVQADLLDHLRTRVVVPLRSPNTVPEPVSRLHPVFDFGRGRHVMATHLISVVPLSTLGEKIGDARHYHDEIVAALDMLFQGF